MRPIRIAINGFGRIGRAALKIALENKDIEVVAINDLGPADFAAYLFKHDTAYGEYDKKVSAGVDFIQVEGKKIPKLTILELAKLPWKDMKVDVVLECTGVFVKAKDAKGHLDAGAKNVINGQGPHG